MECVADFSLRRIAKVSSCLQWNSNSELLLATSEGVMVIGFRVVRSLNMKNATIQLKSVTIPPPSESVYPKGLDRTALIEELKDDHNKVLSMKLDTILCPDMRSMGDMLIIKQVLWEPLSCRYYPRVAVRGQELIVHKLDNFGWRTDVNINLLIHDYLTLHPLDNHTNDSTHKFMTYSCHVKHATWSHRFAHSTASDGHCYLLAANCYGMIFCIKMDLSSPAAITRVLSEDRQNISGICWKERPQNHGLVVIGRDDGTCVAIPVNSDLECSDDIKLTAEKDYRKVDYLQSIEGDEILFAKHREVHILNLNSQQSQVITAENSKFSIQHATANKKHVFISTCDKGILIKDRKTKSTIQIISDAVLDTTIGAALSFSNSILAVVIQPRVPDFYTNKQPLHVKLYSLRPFDIQLEEVWAEDEHAHTDFLLLIGRHATSLPNWFSRVLDDKTEWLNLSYYRLQIVYAALVSFSDSVADTARGERYDDVLTLKLLMSVRRLENLCKNDSTKMQQQMIEAGMNAVRNKISELSTPSSFPTHDCPICGKTLTLETTSYTYTCSGEHSVAICAHTLAPILISPAYVCSRGCGGINSKLNVPVEMQHCLGTKCCFCNFILIKSVLS